VFLCWTKVALPQSNNQVYTSTFIANDAPMKSRFGTCSFSNKVLFFPFAGIIPGVNSEEDEYGCNKQRLVIWCTRLNLDAVRHLWAAGVPGFNCEAAEAIGALLLYSPKAMRSFRTAVFFCHFSVIDWNLFELTEKIKSFLSECLKI